MFVGGGFPDEFVPVLCVRDAILSKNGRTLAIASLRDTLAFPEVSAQMRRLFGPCGYSFPQKPAADMDTVSEEEDFEAWAAHRKAKRAKKDGKSSGGGWETGEAKVLR